MSVLRTLVTVCFAFGLSAAFNIDAAQAQRRLRSAFYQDTPFGSLAWVRNARTRSAARSNLAVVDLTEEACIVLPPTGTQWFMINHHDAELGGEPGYFSVRILYRTESGEADAYGRSGLHVHRNANWYDARGSLTGVYERNPDQIAITDEEFISLHASVSEAAADSYSAIEQAIGPWHMKPTIDSDTSWADRHLYGARLRAYLSANTSSISARLIRFTPTQSTSSGDPVVFWLDPLGSTSALILIDAPRHDNRGSRRVYDVKFGGTCP